MSDNYRLDPSYKTPENLPDGWVAKQLGELVQVSQGGQLGLTKEKDYVSSGIPAYSAAGQDGFVEHAEFRNQSGVVLSTIGSCGRCSYADGDWTTLANVQALLPCPELNARFLFYRGSIENYWEISGSAQPFIKPSSIKKAWVAYPETIFEQERIIDILLSVDESIERTEILINKTQRIKNGLMQEFFNNSTSLSSLYSIVSLVNEKAAMSKDPSKPYIGLEHLPSGGSLLLGTSNPEEYTSICNIFQKDDILFGKLRPRLRKSLRVSFDGYCSTDILVLRATGVDPRFAGYMLQSDPVFAEAIRTEEGTRMPRCSWSTLRNLKVYCPDSAQQQRIANILSTVDDTIEENETLLAKLQQVKAGLMQDLLTGRVRVPATPSPSDTAEAPADV